MVGETLFIFNFIIKFTKILFVLFFVLCFNSVSYLKIINFLIKGFDYYIFVLD